MPSQIEDQDMRHLLRVIHDRYGYDFRGYAEASLKRLVAAILVKTGLGTVARLQHELLRSTDLFATVLPDLTVTTSDMFRDPDFYKVLRHEIIPVLRTYSAFKIWHAGCSRGEEIYSLAILLEEAGLYDRAVIYATDINPVVLQTAKAGLYSAADLTKFAGNYRAAGGLKSFSDYVTVVGAGGRFSERLRKNILFASHNLVVDEVFSEVQVILCRNVLIYFERDLQARALDLFTRSLCFKGHLCLGTKESVRFISGGEAYEEIPGGQRIYRKVARALDEWAV